MAQDGPKMASWRGLDRHGGFEAPLTSKMAHLGSSWGQFETLLRETKTHQTTFGVLRFWPLLECQLHLAKRSKLNKFVEELIAMMLQKRPNNNGMLMSFEDVK